VRYFRARAVVAFIHTAHDLVAIGCAGIVLRISSLGLADLVLEDGRLCCLSSRFKSCSARLITRVGRRVIDGKLARQSQMRRFPAQETSQSRGKCPASILRLVHAQQLVQSRAHFVCSLLVKVRHDVAWSNAVRLDEVCCACVSTRVLPEPGPASTSTGHRTLRRPCVVGVEIARNPFTSPGTTCGALYTATLDHHNCLLVPAGPEPRTQASVPTSGCIRPGTRCPEARCYVHG